MTVCLGGQFAILGADVTACFTASWHVCLDRLRRLQPIWGDFLFTPSALLPDDDVNVWARVASAVGLTLMVILVVLHRMTRGRSSPLAALGFVLGGPMLGVSVFVIAVLNKPAGLPADSFRVCGLAPEEFMQAMIVIGLAAATAFAGTYTAMIKDELRADRWVFTKAPPRRVASSALHALGLHSFATIEEVEQAYRERAKQVHPDHGGDGEEFKRLQAHYDRAKRQVRRRDARG